MAYTDNGMRHLVLELIDEEEKIAAVIPPGCWIWSQRTSRWSLDMRRGKCTIRSKNLFIQHSTLTLIHRIGNPYAPDLTPFGLQCIVEGIP